MTTNGTKSNGHTALDFKSFSNTINGKLVGTKKTQHNINPSTLEANPEVPIVSEEEVNEAVNYAIAAGEKWAEVPVKERQAAVVKFADALASYKDDFASMLTKEQGKPLMFAKMEVDSGVQWLKTQAAIEFPEETVEESDERVVVTRYTALGVAVAIVPWNFPIQLACGKIAPALIAGNALILKPSPFTPYCGLKLGELAQHFFPPGVVQALSGDDSLGPILTAHPGIDKVSFTGSTATGKRVMESCSKTLKRVTLELGGKDPAIICSDVDIKATAPKIAQLALLNSGQICIAIKRIYIHASIYDEFLAAMVEAVKSFAIGDGFKEGVYMGPIQNKMQFERVKGFLEELKEKKLDLAVGGDMKTVSDVGKGYFVTPTIVNNPPDDSRIVTEEPFGPIFPVLKWETEDEVVRRANDTLMGLGASVWTQNLETASRLAKKMKAGNVWVNTHLELQPNAAFGGHKQSGLGAEWGLQGLKSYCNAQTLYLRKK
ncbi:aldehyde dehydrogenase [Tothia fuscella]|uniref:aldehyde dehydrogenase (NAD(+)) n=1 Tax=Tothia fuscella TaxID=1048955 RepID=A0A9P4NG37_9PEZI|nr:aldehyde dehydrogenase [Tothia fuscella]